MYSDGDHIYNLRFLEIKSQGFYVGVDPTERNPRGFSSQSIFFPNFAMFLLYCASLNIPINFAKISPEKFVSNSYRVSSLYELGFKKNI